MKEKLLMVVGATLLICVFVPFLMAAAIWAARFFFRLFGLL